MGNNRPQFTEKQRRILAKASIETPWPGIKAVAERMGCDENDLRTHLEIIAKASREYDKKIREQEQPPL